MVTQEALVGGLTLQVEGKEVIRGVQLNALELGVELWGEPLLQNAVTYEPVLERPLAAADGQRLVFVDRREQVLERVCDCRPLLKVEAEVLREVDVLPLEGFYQRCTVQQ